MTLEKSNLLRYFSVCMWTNSITMFGIAQHRGLHDVHLATTQMKGTHCLSKVRRQKTDCVLPD